MLKIKIELYIDVHCENLINNLIKLTEEYPKQFTRQFNTGNGKWVKRAQARTRIGWQKINNSLPLILKAKIDDIIISLYNNF